MLIFFVAPGRLIGRALAIFHIDGSLIFLVDCHGKPANQFREVLPELEYNHSNECVLNLGCSK
jgi:hypothetical protein